ncbi:sulfite exporter TauE/SafE family protein [Mariprofundus erugo]|uniref:sulfite exporter TauE/SafE family protein n=1 Tax=Mariprofundus erugo TaxID=2528639 RepID=UPI0010FE64BE|nr:sulfite exporter TauE/SafE family protein [Mariprofundus erugo]TLS75613.1 sulfite exporter TauE/SafE family protein [Mariprofundus erugo]
MLVTMVLAPLIGVLLALFGAGGGMITVPLLAYGVGLPIKVAIAASLWIVASVSLVTVLRKRAWQVIRPKLLLVFAIGGFSGSWIGSYVGLAIPDQLQSVLFGILVLFVAWWMRRATAVQASGSDGFVCRCFRTFILALILGIVTGVLGVGAGFLIVPALIWLGISDFRVAVAHSLVVITLNATVAGISYLGHIDLDVAPVLLIAVLAAAGSLIGCRFAGHLPESALRSGFSLLLLIVGAGMLLAPLVRQLT